MMDLTLTERSDLDALESIVNRGLKTFIEVGRALAEIRDRRLYRQTHKTFEDYCRGKWEMNSSRARQLIAAADTVEAMESVTTVTPTSERQVRPLVGIKDPEQQRETWERAVETAEAEGVPVTARHVEEAKGAVADPEPERGGVHLKGHDLFVWQLKNLYQEAPRRAQNTFRRWVNEVEAARG